MTGNYLLSISPTFRWKLTKQFKKDNGESVSIEYGGLICDYCEIHTCDHIQYMDELDSI